jgi:hypothetical protein
MAFPIIEPIKCAECGEDIDEHNHSGHFFTLIENEFGMVVEAPICDSCNRSDNGSEKNGAY